MLFGPQQLSSTKVEKNRHFPKRLVHGFCQKVDVFFICFFFLSQKSQKERFFDILDRKEYFLDLKSELLKKSKKSTFCKGVSPWFFSKNRPFSYMFFLTKKSQKERFFDILDRNECFLDLKSEVLKRSKKSTFCKRVSPWFLSKNRLFSYMFFFQPKKPERNIFFSFWIVKNAFQTRKVKFQQSKKNRHFAKGLVHGFC